MYMQFEEAGLIRRTEEYEKKMNEKGSAADQSCAEPINNTQNAISMLIMA